jgi:hypothetical protein
MGTITGGKDYMFPTDNAGFDRLALELFKRQYQSNPIYQAYTDAIGRDPASVLEVADIPFLPIGFFKTHRVITGDFDPEIIFESSGTTDTQKSRHWIRDLSLYRESFIRGFERMYGETRSYVILGLLPGYLERPGSSLAFMVGDLIRRSANPESGFYLHEFRQLHQMIRSLEAAKKQALLIGVTFALMDFADRYPMELEHTLVMETGGMKGRGREPVRAELHGQLKQKLGIKQVHAEYGMTELLSQAYAKTEGRFVCPPWMKVVARSEDDPFQWNYQGAGPLNIIDLANRDSCAFIATEDIGICHADQSFEVLGRMDGSSLRGCSLMIA